MRQVGTPKILLVPLAKRERKRAIRTKQSLRSRVFYFRFRRPATERRKSWKKGEEDDEAVHKIQRPGPLDTYTQHSRPTLLAATPPKGGGNMESTSSCQHTVKLSPKVQCNAPASPSLAQSTHPARFGSRSVYSYIRSRVSRVSLPRRATEHESAVRGMNAPPLARDFSL